jgi:hypothetical protein
LHLLRFLAEVALRDAKVIAPQPARRGAGSETPQTSVEVCSHVNFTIVDGDGIVESQ